MNRVLQSKMLRAGCSLPIATHHCHEKSQQNNFFTGNFHEDSTELEIFVLFTKNWIRRNWTFMHSHRSTMFDQIHQYIYALCSKSCTDCLKLFPFGWNIDNKLEPSIIAIMLHWSRACYFIDIMSRSPCFPCQCLRVLVFPISTLFKKSLSLLFHSIRKSFLHEFLVTGKTQNNNTLAVSHLQNSSYFKIMDYWPICLPILT